MDEAKKPEFLGKVDDFVSTEKDHVLLTVLVRNIEHKGKMAYGISFVTSKAVQEELKNNDTFRYAVKEAFSKWLDDEIMGIV